MTRERFETFLDQATVHTVAFARTMVNEVLPAEIRYQLRGHDGKSIGPVITKYEFVAQLWHDGKVPRWIDLSVLYIDQNFTCVDAFPSNDHVENEEACIYASRGLGPFGVKSPCLPPNWISVEKSGRFALSKRSAPPAIS